MSALIWAKSPPLLPTSMQNSQLREQLESETDRVLPKTEYFSFAIDGLAYLRSTGDREFYHGVGYWAQVRTEAQMNPKFRANLRTLLYAGSVSYGYASPSNQFHILGLTGEFDGPFESQGKLRALDLERQTWGQGILVEDKEMNGLWLQFQTSEAEVNMRVNGTGTFYISDDTYNTELALWDGKLRGGLIEWSEAEVSLPYLGVDFSGDVFSLKAEGIEYKDTRASLVKLGMSFEENFWTMQCNLVSRQYSNGFLDLFVGKIQHEYISFDQYNKRMNNALNILSYDNHVQASSLNLLFDYAVTDQYKIYIDSEVGIFDFQDRDDRKYGFYRAGVAYFPFVPRQDIVQFYVSNKVMDNTGATRPSGRSIANSPLFFEHNHFGFETSFRF